MKTEKYQYRWWALIGLSILAFTAYLDFTIISVAIPYIQASLKVNIITLQWVSSIYAMFLSMFMIIVGKFGDIFGRRKIFYFGFMLFTIAAIGAAISQTIYSLIFFRALQGLAGAIIFTLSAALATQSFGVEEEQRAIGIYGAITGLGLALGPFLGGILISVFSWRSVFWINIPIIFVGFILCSFSLSESEIKKEKPKIDWGGFFLLIIAIGTLVFGIIRSETVGFLTISTWLFISIGILAFIVLFFVEKKSSCPLLEFTFLKSNQVRLAVIVSMITGAILFIFLFFDPLYLSAIKFYPSETIGLILLSAPIMQIVIALLFDKSCKIFGLSNLLFFAIIAALFSAIMHGFLTPTSSIFYIIITLLLVGFIWGFANTGIINAINRNVSSDKIGSSLGTTYTLWNIFGSIFLAISTVIFNHFQKVSIFKKLKDTHINLTSSQHAQILKMLSDPKKIEIFLKDALGAKASIVVPLVSQSFLRGFHGVAWFLSTVLFLALLIAFTFWRHKNITK